MLELKVWEYQEKENMNVANRSGRHSWRKAGLRHGMRQSGPSQKAISAILKGEPVRIATLTKISACDGTSLRGHITSGAQIGKAIAHAVQLSTIPALLSASGSSAKLGSYLESRLHLFPRDSLTTRYHYLAP